MPHRAEPSPVLPPGPRLPPAAQRLAWSERPVGFAAGCLRRHGATFTVRFGRGLTLVLVSDPAEVRRIFAAPPEDVRRGPAPTRRLVLGDGSVVVLDGEEHARHRALLRPPLHGAAVDAYAATIAGVAGRSVDQWPRGSAFALTDELRDLTTEVLLRVVCGLDGETAGGVRDRGRLREALLELRRATVRRAPSIPLVRRRWGPGVPTRRLRAALDRVDTLLLAEIAARRAAGEDRGDVLCTLLAAQDPDGRRLGDREVRDEVLTLLLTGHAPMLAALAWTFERLVRRPAELERIRRDPEGRYADAAVREVLRLRPPAWLTNARTTARPLRVGGHLLPTGTMVSAFTYLLHRRPDAFSDPLAFRPERFLDRAPDPSWIPFGGGRRRCVGEHLALLTCATVLRTAAERVDLRPASAGDALQREVGTVFLPADGAAVVAQTR